MHAIRYETPLYRSDFVKTTQTEVIDAICGSINVIVSRWSDAVSVPDAALYIQNCANILWSK